MSEITKKSEIVYCGIDFHKNTTTYCALSERGELVEPITTIRTSQLVRHMVNRRNWRLGIEASGGVNHVVEALKGQGHEVLIFNSNKFRGIGIGGKKTDERDCRALAECLRLNFVPEVHHKSKYSREIKALLVQREMLVRSRVNMINHVRGTLREFGLTMGVGVECFLKEVALKIEELNDPLIGRGLSSVVSMIKQLKSQELELEQALREKTKNDERIKRLMTIPGIGVMTSYAMVCVVDDVQRFKNAKEFSSYLGLTPKVQASGSVRMMGSITRSGSEILRRYLIHGARAWMRYAPDRDRNREWAERVKDRRGVNKAVVALAHRTARIAFAVLRDGTSYTGRPKKKAMKLSSPQAA